MIAIEEIGNFLGDGPKLFDDFFSNLCLRRAIERNIEIIGAVTEVIRISVLDSEGSCKREVLWTCIKVRR